MQRASAELTALMTGSADLHTTLLTFLAIFVGFSSVALALRCQASPQQRPANRRRGLLPANLHSPRRSRRPSYDQPGSPQAPASPSIKSRSFVESLKTCFDDDLDSNLLLDGYAMSEYILQAAAGRAGDAQKPQPAMWSSQLRRASSKQASARSSVEVAASGLRDSVASHGSSCCYVSLSSVPHEITSQSLPIIKSWSTPASSGAASDKCLDATMYL